MLIMAICAVGFCVGLLLVEIWDDFCAWNFIGGLLITLCGAILAIGLIVKPMGDVKIKAQIWEFKSIRLTLKTARANENNLEVAAIQTKVMDANAWLARKKYYKTTLLSWWVPSDVLDLEPIE